MTTQYSIHELCALAGIPVRTLRFYVQKGVVDRPIGEKRGAYYTQKHLEQVLLAKRWSAAGLNLEQIREIQQGEAGEIPPRRRRPGDVQVVSHVFIAEGLEVVLDPGLVGWSPAQVRAFARGVMALYQHTNDGGDAPVGESADE